MARGLADPLEGVSRRSTIAALDGSAGDLEPRGTRTAWSRHPSLMDLPVPSAVGVGARMPLSTERSALVRAYLAHRGSASSRPWAWNTARRAATPTDLLAGPARGVGLAGTGTNLLNLFARDTGLSRLGGGLNLLTGGLNLTRGLRRGNALQAASGGVEAIGGAAQFAGAPGVSAFTGPAAFGLGLAGHDPAGVISGAAGTVTGGIALAAPALAASGVTTAAGMPMTAAQIAGAANLWAAPLALVPAVSMFLGSQRSAAIESGYQRKAKQAAQAFVSNPDVQQAGATLSRFQAGDQSALPSLERTLAEAIKTGEALRQPDRGNPEPTVGPYIHAIWHAIASTPFYPTSLINVAKMAFPGEGAGGWLDHDGSVAFSSAYDRLQDFGFGPGVPPPGYDPNVRLPGQLPKVLPEQAAAKATGTALVSGPWGIAPSQNPGFHPYGAGSESVSITHDAALDRNAAIMGGPASTAWRAYVNKYGRGPA